MKTLKSLTNFRIWITAFFITLSSLTGAVYAQSEIPEKVNVNINTHSDGATMWYSQPWVWVIGVAVFIIIIVALSRGDRRGA